MLEQTKEKNDFNLKKKSNIAFSASPLGFLLAACGGGGEDETSSGANSSTTTSSNSSTANSSNSNTTTTFTSTNSSGQFASNLNNLSSFYADQIDNFTGVYTGYDEVPSPLVDQSQSESYFTGFKDTTALVGLTGKNEIDGLLYEYWNQVTKTEFWNGAAGNKTISFSFFNSELKLLDESAYTNSAAIAQIYNNGFY